MLKKIGVVLVFLAIFVVMLMFTRLNPGMIEIDLAVGTFETSVPIAFTVAFVAGWLFGVLCLVAYVIRLVNERRQLRKSLRLAESEVSSLRNLPITDAD